MENYDFLDEKLKQYLMTTTGKAIFQGLTQGMSRQKRSRIKMNLLELPEKYQELWNIRQELGRANKITEMLEADKEVV